MEKMTIREYYELVKNENGDGQFEKIINDDIDKFCSPDMVKAFESLTKKINGYALFYIEDDDDGWLNVSSNWCGNYYFKYDVPMEQVFEDLYDEMNKGMLSFIKDTEMMIEEETHDNLLDALECNEEVSPIRYKEWWDDMISNKFYHEIDWSKDEHYEKFCDDLYCKVQKLAKDYGYDVKEVDGGLDLVKK